jgi:threonine/homoserine/homoserine lactone efflux protein
VTDSGTLTVFALASITLAVIPGPNVLYIVSQGVDRGRRAGVVSALGVASGGLVHVAAAIVGLSALLAASAEAFTAVKIAGAVYLVWLGLRTLLASDESATARRLRATLAHAYGQGVVVSVLNPKTALFFVAFLPQFVDPRDPARLQLAVLGALFVAILLVGDTAWALASGTAGSMLRRSRLFGNVQRYVAGSLFVLLGVLAAFTGRHQRTG